MTFHKAANAMIDFTTCNTDYPSVQARTTAVQQYGLCA